MYKKAYDKFLDTNYINMNFDFFAKSNEIHLNDDSRPRAIFNPSWEFKALGSYVARFFIRIMKHIEPGFISGMND